MSRHEKKREAGSFPTFTLAQAARVMRGARQPGIAHIAAADILAKHSQDPEKVSIDDLLECLRRGGVAPEMGARALNVRTGRRQDSEIGVV